MMRKLALPLLLLLVSCMDSSKPRPVAEKFLEAMRERDYEEAAEYSTVETAKLLKQLERIEDLQAGDQRPEMGKITIIAEEVQGKTATVFFREEGVPEEQKITLQKVSITNESGAESREWKVALRKEELPLPAAPLIE